MRYILYLIIIRIRRLLYLNSIKFVEFSLYTYRIAYVMQYIGNILYRAWRRPIILFRPRLVLCIWGLNMLSSFLFFFFYFFYFLKAADRIKRVLHLTKWNVQPFFFVSMYTCRILLLLYITREGNACCCFFNLFPPLCWPLYNGRHAYTVAAASLYTLCSNIRLFTAYWRIVWAYRKRKGLVFVAHFSFLTQTPLPNFYLSLRFSIHYYFTAMLKMVTQPFLT